MALMLSELQRFDPQAPPARGDEQRFCCPLGGVCDGKPIDATHRSLCVNVQTGQWTCQRCHQAGILGEFRPTPEARSPRVSLRQAFAVPPPEPPPVDNAWQADLRGIVPLVGTLGETYLSGRGIPVDRAHAAGVRFSADWFGRPAVLFPVRSREGALVGTAGRYTDDGKPKTRDAGRKSAGVFTTPGAWEAVPLVLVEGPVDALSLHLAGYPAIALMGCSLSDVVAWSCALRRVAVAMDADAAGDQAAESLMSALRVRGCDVIRLRPPDLRDWNDLLREWGAEHLGREVAEALKAATSKSCGVSGAERPGTHFGKETGQDLDVAPAPEWTEEEQAEYDAILGEVAAAMPDGDLISWVRERFGCQLRLDEKGGLRAENAAGVPGPVRAEIRGRQGMLVARLKRDSKD